MSSHDAPEVKRRKSALRAPLVAKAYAGTRTCKTAQKRNRTGSPSLDGCTVLRCQRCVKETHNSRRHTYSAHSCSSHYSRKQLSKRRTGRTRPKSEASNGHQLVRGQTRAVDQYEQHWQDGDTR